MIQFHRKDYSYTLIFPKHYFNQIIIQVIITVNLQKNQIILMIINFSKARECRSLLANSRSDCKLHWY
jgi:hypothetical protein